MQATQVDDPWSSESIIIVRAVLFWLFGVLGCLTIVTHIAQLSNWPFKTYVMIASTLAASVPAILHYATKRQLVPAANQDRKVLLTVIAVGLVGMVLALVISRPDIDDYYYVPNAVHYVQNPADTMGFEVHFVYSGGAPFTSIFPDTSGAYEYIQSIVAYVLGIDYLTVYYILAVAFAGFLIPVSLFLAIAHFSDKTSSAVVGTLITIFIILLLGETHRTFGNLSFARAFQGKVVLFSVGIPMLAAFSIDYLKHPTIRSWLVLFFLVTALTGASSTALVLLPAFSVLMVISCAFSMQSWKETLQHGLGYFASFSYLALCAIYSMGYASANLTGSSPIIQGWPTSFDGQMKFLFNPNAPITPITLGVFSVLSIWLTSGKSKKLLGAWIVSALILFLNPVVAPFLIEYVTTPNIYWRMVFLYPFPLVVGISASILFAHTRKLSAAKRTTILLFVCMVLVSLQFLIPSASVFQELNVRVSWPAYKVSSEVMEYARRLIAIAPKGPMLAPIDLAGMIAMLDSGFPQVGYREDGVRLWLYERGRVEEAEVRIRASDYLDGTGGNMSSLQSLLNDYTDIHSIVIRDIVFERQQVRDLLQSAHYASQKSVGQYVIVLK